MGDASWLGAAGGGGPMAAAAADAEERAERFVGLLPGGGGRPLFVDILQWELGLDQKRKVVVRGQERTSRRLAPTTPHTTSCTSSAPQRAAGRTGRYFQLVGSWALWSGLSPP